MIVASGIRTNIPDTRQNGVSVELVPEQITCNIGKITTNIAQVITNNDSITFNTGAITVNSEGIAFNIEQITSNIACMLFCNMRIDHA